MRGGVTSTLVLAAIVVGGCVSGDDDGASPPLPAVPGVSDSPQGVHLYVANLDGSGIRRLTRGESVRRAPVWAPSGRAIAVVSTRSRTEAAPGADPEVAIEVLAPDGRHIRRIPVSSGTGRVAWSPDSLRLAFISPARSRHGTLGQLVVHPLGRGGGRVLSERARSDTTDGPAWSPDGRRIAFPANVLRPPLRGRDDVAPPALPELFVIGADGRDERRLTRGLHEEGEPHWLDDERVLFQQRVAPAGPGPSRRVLVTAPDGGTPRIVTAGLYYWIPSVSPDGRWVAAAAVSGDQNSRLRLYVARVGGRLKQVVPGMVVERPTWSPDGREVAFASGSRVFAVRRDGRGLQLLVELSGREIRDIAWSPDGKRIAFTSVTPAAPEPTRPPSRPVQPTPPGHE